MLQQCRLFINFAVSKLESGTNPLQKSSVFCAHNLLENNNRKEWGKSNLPEAFALECLTAPTAVSFV